MSLRPACALLLPLVLLASGCSWARMQTLPDYWPGGSEPECTEGNTLYAADLVLTYASALGATVAAAMLYGGDAGSDAATVTLASAVVLGAGGTVLFPFSAAHGRRHARVCKAAHLYWETRPSSESPAERSSGHCDYDEGVFVCLGAPAGSKKATLQLLRAPPFGPRALGRYNLRIYDADENPTLIVDVHRDRLPRCPGLLGARQVCVVRVGRGYLDVRFPRDQVPTGSLTLRLEPISRRGPTPGWRFRIGP